MRLKPKKRQILLQMWVVRNCVYVDPILPRPNIFPRVLVVKHISKAVGEACTCGTYGFVVIWGSVNNSPPPW